MDHTPCNPSNNWLYATSALHHPLPPTLCTHPQCDPLWRLPLWAGYRKMLDSKVADIGSTGEPGAAGSITAALFLQEFAKGAPSWLHIDTAGTAPLLHVCLSAQAHTCWKARQARDIAMNIVGMWVSLGTQA